MSNAKKISISAPAESWVTEGGLTRAAVRLALPMMGTALLQDLFTIVDLIFVGRLGAAAIAAVTISSIALGLVYVLAMGIATGCTALVAEAVGGGDRHRAEAVASQSLLIALALSVGLVVFVMPFARQLLSIIGLENDALAAGVIYLQISVATSFTIFLSVSLSSALRGAGDAVTPLKIMGFGNLVNIVLDPILIFGWFGVPALGVAGSAWATAIAKFISVTLLAWVFFVNGHDHFHLQLKDLKPQWEVIGQVFKIGIFGSGQMLTRNVSSLILARIVSMFGMFAVAAYGIGMRLNITVIVMGMGFGNAAATLVGQNLGAQKSERALRAGWLTTGICAILFACITIIFWTLTKPLIGVFNSQPEVVAIGASFIRWFSATYCFMSLSVVLGGAMNGAGDTFRSMVITAFTLAVFRIPLAYGLAVWWGSVTGVWVGMAVSNVIQGFLFAGVFQQGKWKEKLSGVYQGGEVPDRAGVPNRGEVPKMTKVAVRPKGAAKPKVATRAKEQKGSKRARRPEGARSPQRPNAGEAD